MNTSKKVLLLGAGYVLERLARSIFENEQYELYLTTRSSQRVSELKRRYPRVYQLDIANSDAVKEFFRDKTFHYCIDSIPPLKEGGKDPGSGVRNIVSTLTRTHSSSLKGIIYLSSTGVYGGEDGRWVDESSPLEAESSRGVARRIVEDVYKSTEFRVLSARLSGIWGDDRGILRALQAGHYKVRRGRWSNRIHVDDIVTTLITLLEDEKPWPESICVSDDEPARIEEVVDFLCDKLELSHPGYVEGESFNEFQRSSQRVSNKLLKEFLGKPLHYPTYRSMVGKK